MTMIFQLLVFTCACALGAAGDMAAYGDIWKTIETAFEILQDNVLSMDGNVTALNDPRRHYAAIIHVVSSEASAELNPLLGHNYYRDYQKNINQSLPFAYANPEIVIQETRRRMDDVLDAINKKEQDIFLAAGLAATELILNDKRYFAETSQNLTSNNFVINGAKKLRNIVMALKNLYQLLYRRG